MLTLNESVKTAIEISQSLAKEYHNAGFSSPHLLMALMHKQVGLRKFLDSIGKDSNYIYEWAEVRLEEFPKIAQVKENVTGDQAIQRIFEEADNIRIKLGLDSITPICVLTAISKPGIGFTSDELKSFPIKEREILDLYLKENTIQQVVASQGETATHGNGSGGFLLKYCVERTALAKEGKTDPIIGRDKETRMMMEILCRRTKPNVIITGESGVGKTALVDGFSLDIVNNIVPSQLTDSKVFELDLGALIAGASYKGEIEDRIKNILKELKQADKAILFIDEIHILLDNKGSVGAGVANLLKPELARGEITLIGATTNDEYRKLIEPDQAFSRRFEVLNVAEPDTEAAVKMLQRLTPKFEDHHKLKIDTDAVSECVRLAKRYIKDRHLPDAAIDLMDRTMAAIKLMTQTSGHDLANLKVEFEKTLSNKDKFHNGELFNEYKWMYSLLTNRLSPVLIGKLNDETQPDKFETAEEYETYLQETLVKLIALAENKIESVTKEDIAAIISYKTGIPLGKIQAGEKEKLLNMEAYLKKRVVGQDHAVKAVSEAILESRSGLNKKGQPIGSFFFLGPTGTGKTELAKSIAEFLFNDETAMIRFDMSEFKEEHSAALLYGAPPGYVGYEEGGMLVNKIRQKPYSVLLFDEIEKAHPSVFDTFLQILDEGKMHDRLGKEGDFSNSLILFTSNIGSEWIAEQFDKGLMPTSNKLTEIMTKYFRPEFLARLTEIVPFAPINEKSLVRIFEIQLRGLLDALEKQGIEFTISEEAKMMLAKNGFTPKYGARQISGVIRNNLRRPISKYIISGQLQKGNKVNISRKKEVDELEWAID
jgi:ATP-dependent Clp protease ATP-binding subunit ClpA